MNVDSRQWWRVERDRLLSLYEHCPAYVYHKKTAQENVKKLSQLTSINKIFYAMKANANDNILKLFYELELGFECVSIDEVKKVLSLFPMIKKTRILFTPNFAPKTEYEYAFQQGVTVNLDNLYPLQQWPELFYQRDIFLRIDTAEEAGHHRHVCTAGNASKFGIDSNQLSEAITLVNKTGATVIGLHCHSGSGVLEPEVWRRNAEFLVNVLPQFPKVRVLNIGGGLGVVEKPEQTALDLKRLNEMLLAVKKTVPFVEFWLEPGRFLVAEAGVLLARVTQIKQKGDVRFVGIETGMNSLIRPALYDAYHPIVNLSKLYEPDAYMAHIVGPICESGDTLGHDRALPVTVENDVLLIANAGAYGQVMSSYYNLRKPASEYYLE